MKLSRTSFFINSPAIRHRIINMIVLLNKDFLSLICTFLKKENSLKKNRIEYETVKQNPKNITTNNRTFLFLAANLVKIIRSLDKNPLKK
jgi:hypothetical protein